MKIEIYVADVTLFYENLKMFLHLFQVNYKLSVICARNDFIYLPEKKWKIEENCDKREFILMMWLLSVKIGRWFLHSLQM